MTFESEWAKAIRGRAAELGLNQADIGRVLGMSKQTGHRIWKGAQRPTVEQCDELEVALMMEPDELRVLCGYLPKGNDPKVERGENEVVVRLSTMGFLVLVPIIYDMPEEAWAARPIDDNAEPDILAA